MEKICNKTKGGYKYHKVIRSKKDNVGVCTMLEQVLDYIWSIRSSTKRGVFYISNTYLTSEPMLQVLKTIFSHLIDMILQSTTTSDSNMLLSLCSEASCKEYGSAQNCQLFHHWEKAQYNYKQTCIHFNNRDYNNITMLLLITNIYSTQEGIDSRKNIVVLASTNYKTIVFCIKLKVCKNIHFTLVYREVGN